MLRKLLTGGALALALTICPLATAQERTAEAIYNEYMNTKGPALDQSRRDDQAYVQQYRAQVMEIMNKRAELAKELWDVDPNHEKALELMKFRWSHLAQTGKAEEAMAEIDAALAKAPPDKKADIAFAKAQTSMMNYSATPEAMLAGAEEFIKAYPGDARGGDLLARAAMRVDDNEKATALYRRVVNDFPSSRSAEQAKGKLRQAEGIGKPFELSFTEATTGKPMSMADLKGKVVVIDFWATWCGPCVAEMPHMKEIYAKYKDKGVEFIGISLDVPESQGGLQKLKDYVAKNDIQWPQYYQGKGWDSEFSKSWGINSIPALFVVDQKGYLHSNNARGKVEPLIESLLGGPERTGG